MYNNICIYIYKNRLQLYELPLLVEIQGLPSFQGHHHKQDYHFQISKILYSHFNRI